MKARPNLCWLLAVALFLGFALTTTLAEDLTGGTDDPVDYEQTGSAPLTWLLDFEEAPQSTNSSCQECTRIEARCLSRCYWHCSTQPCYESCDNDCYEAALPCYQANNCV